jgi:hypothetical protein
MVTPYGGSMGKGKDVGSLGVKFRGCCFKKCREKSENPIVKC